MCLANYLTWGNRADVQVPEPLLSVTHHVFLYIFIYLANVYRVFVVETQTAASAHGT